MKNKKSFVSLLSLFAATTFFIFVGGSGAALAQSNNGKIVEQIMKMEAEYNESSKRPNAPADFDRFYADDFMVTMRLPPQIRTKAESQARMKDPNFKRGTIESLIDDDIKVRVYGDDAAIATGHWTRISKDADGKDTSASGRFTRVWVKQNGKWLLAAAHYSPDIDLEKLKVATAKEQSTGKKN
jgi:ketosteroid isomerase-like protein